MKKSVVSLSALFCLSVFSLMAQTPGNLTLERWDALPASYSVLELQKEGVAKRAPDTVSLLAGAEWIPGQGNNFGIRMRGTVTAPVTAAYTFYISGDRIAELYLSHDSSRFNKKRIAWQHLWIDDVMRDRNPTVRSETINLTAGEKYYIEIHATDWDGDDPLSVGWAYEAPVALTESAVGDPVAQTWTETAGIHSLSVDAGEIWVKNDRFAYKHRTWTGDGEFIARVSAMNNPHNRAIAGLMLRTSLDTDSVNAAVFRKAAGGVSFQFRTNTAANTGSTAVSPSWEWIKLVRRGETLAAYTSRYGENWIKVGGKTLPGLPATVYVGMAATDYSNNNTPVTATIENLVFRAVSASESIPAAQLESVTPDANDVDDDNLPDDWESQKGLDSTSSTGDNGEFGDPDNDGIDNFTEYQLGTNPNQKDELLDGLTRERWEVMAGNSINSLVQNRERFLRLPSERAHVAGIDENMHGDRYATRHRGSITAPATGNYTFWVSGNDEIELWLSDGTLSKEINGVSTPLTNRYGKQKLAWIHDQRYGRYWSLDDDLDILATQRSRIVYLEAGQQYYLEVLHKENNGGDYISLSWQTPGGQRQVIPASVFSSDIPEDDDLDDDNLPAAWESQYGLNPADNGLTDSRDGQYGDWDQDGLTNFEEYQLGTDPTNADSDGDTLTDKEERDYYGTDPLTSNLLASSLHTQVDLTTYEASSNAWETGSNGELISTERRGYIDYAFSVIAGEEGIFEVHISGGAAGLTQGWRNLPLEISLNGELIGKVTLKSKDGATASTKHLTPWLAAGNYTLRIKNTNYRSQLKLRLDSVELYRLGGVDADSDGIADWLESKLEEENYTTRVPVESFTSPASVEGMTPSLASFGLTKSIVDDQGQPAEQEQEVLAGINGGFFSHIELNTQGSTELTFNFQNGSVVKQESITWKDTNILEFDTLTIRKGDALKLAAWEVGNTQSGTFTLTQDGQPVLLGDGTLNHSVAHLVDFDIAGTYSFEATWQPDGGGQPVTDTLTVTVKEADFGPVFDVMAWNRRTWEIQGVANDMDVFADDALTWNETTANGQVGRSFTVDIYEVGTRYVLARLPETGEIIARGVIQGFSVAAVSQTSDAQLVAVEADGTRRYRFTIAADGLPPNAEIRLRNYYQGTAFLNGGNELVITAEDFNTNGLADIYVETGPGGNPQLCHSINVFLIN